VLPADSEEFAKRDLTLVFRVGCTFHICNECFPVLADFAEELAENLDGLVLVHLLMEHAKVLVILGWLPAFFMLATVDFALLGLVLAEVQSFGWEHLRANRKLEILV